MAVSLPSFVVDTSVAIKWYVEREEKNVLQALELLEAWGGGRCILRAPDLLVFELANALTSGRGFKFRQVMDSINHFQALGLNLEALRWNTLAKAAQIASSCGATVYDSYFLAMALESDSVLVTADQIFLRKAHRYPGIVSIGSVSLPA